MQKLSLPKIFLASVSLCVGSVLVAQTPALIDNDQVRVLKAVDKAHVKGKAHEHKLNRVMLYLTSARQEITPEGGKKQVLNIKAGDVKFSPATGMHVGEVTSDQDLVILEVELKTKGNSAKLAPGPLDPLKVAPKSYHLEFENDQVRVIRVKMAAHSGVPQHEHALNRVVLYVSDQDTRMTSSEGKVEEAKHKAGDASWGAPVTHKEDNLQDKPFEAIMVELKK